MKTIYKLVTVVFFLMSTFAKSATPNLYHDLQNYSVGYNTNTHVLTFNHQYWNTSNGNYTGAFTVGYYISTDAYLDPSNMDATDYYITDSYDSGLSGGQGAALNFQVDFDDIENGSLPTGQYEFIVYIDDGKQVTESNENDNSLIYYTVNYTNTTTDIKKQADAIFATSSIGYSKENQSLTISMGSEFNGMNMNVELFDLTGKAIMKKTTICEQHNSIPFSTNISLNGLYLVSVTIDEKSVVKKIMVN